MVNRDHVHKGMLVVTEDQRELGRIVRFDELAFVGERLRHMVTGQDGARW